MLVTALIWCAGLLKDKNALKEDLIRFHVVANSDSVQDRNIKLQVRDAVIDSLQKELGQLSDPETARTYLQQNLSRIQAIANEVLDQLGAEPDAVVTLGREAFDTRYYDTFALPAGIYESLRIVIGNGEGHNWWCVAFPSLCAPATKDMFRDTAMEAGFTETLCDTLAGESHEIRFFLLDKLGQLENIFFEG